MTKRNRFIFISSLLIVAAMLVCLMFGNGGDFAFAFETQPNEDIKPLYDLIGDRAENFLLKDKTNNAFGTVYDYDQYYNGMKVVGGEFIVAMKDGEIIYFDDNSFDIKSVIPSKISEYSALSTVREFVGDAKILSVEKVVCKQDNDFVESFMIDVLADEGKTFIVSGLSGEILKETALDIKGVLKTNEDSFGNSVHIDVDFLNNTYYLHDAVRNIYVVDYRNKNTINSNLKFDVEDCFSSESGEDFYSKAVTVYNNIQKAYDFYTDEDFVGDGAAIFGINNKNDKTSAVGADEYKIYVLMDYGVKTEEKSNATFSYSKQLNHGYMSIGAGVAAHDSLYNVDKGFDIIAHEYQHGVTGFTVSLDYVGESGALDEAFSDIFGSLIEGNDPSDLNSGFWTIGEDCMYDTDYLRSLYDDNRLNPQYVYNIWDQQICKEPGDHENHSNCDKNYVHANSTIISNVQYQLCRLQPDFFTRENISKLWYATLTMLPDNANFNDFTTCFIECAKALDFEKDIMDSVYLSLQTVGLLHRIVYLNEDNSPIKDIYVLHNSAVEKPEDPTFEDGIYDYTFEGWDEVDSDGRFIATSDGSIKKTVFDAIFKARYSKGPIKYTATFLDGSGNKIVDVEFGFGEKITPPNVSLPTDGDFEYEVAWSLENGDIVDLENSRFNKDVTLRLVFLRYVDIKFFNEGVLYFEYHGLYDDLQEVLNELAPPIKTQSVEYVYSFSGWDKSIENIKTGMDINALYERSKRIYNVTFVVNGEVKDVVGFYYGDKIERDIPVKGKKFEGWYFDKNFTLSADNATVTEDVVVYAKLSKSTNLYLYIGIGAGAFVILSAAIITIIVVVQKRKNR